MVACVCLCVDNLLIARENVTPKIGGGGAGAKASPNEFNCHLVTLWPILCATSHLYVCVQ